MLDRINKIKKNSTCWKQIKIREFDIYNSTNGVLTIDFFNLQQFGYFDI